MPILADCPSWFVGRVLERVDAGDHVAFLLDPVAAEHGATGGALTFHRARHIAPGHEA